MKIADNIKLRSIAFPNISTGVYAYPKAQAARVAVTTVRAFLESSAAPEQVVFCVFDEENARLYERLLG